MQHYNPKLEQKLEKNFSTNFPTTYNEDEALYIGEELNNLPNKI
jgi:hypothetical protein